MDSLFCRALYREIRTSPCIFKRFISIFLFFFVSRFVDYVNDARKLFITRQTIVKLYFVGLTKNYHSIFIRVSLLFILELDYSRTCECVENSAHSAFSQLESERFMVKRKDSQKGKYVVSMFELFIYCICACMFVHVCVFMYVYK